jgi:hypothetical protein
MLPEELRYLSHHNEIHRWVKVSLSMSRRHVWEQTNSSEQLEMNYFVTEIYVTTARSIHKPVFSDQ